MSDVIVQAPPAVALLGGGTSAELRQALADLDQLRTTASTIANIAICLAAMHRDSTGADPLIPASLHKRMKGAQIALSETPDGDVLVRHRERALHPVVAEEV